MRAYYRSGCSPDKMPAWEDIKAEIERSSVQAAPARHHPDVLALENSWLLALIPPKETTRRLLPPINAWDLYKGPTSTERSRKIDEMGRDWLVQEPKAIKNARGNPCKIDRRPKKRRLSNAPQEVIDKWFKGFPITIGSIADTEEKNSLVRRPCHTWKDVWANTINLGHRDHQG
ncbi:hypothetical protein GGTG_01274 [Gaeumannomyces tritici R3-111a-1]|uniref:Uncharacterized protein n=1 Tax=Gaeumannomyces tritici (strain R3-111a-1) TaxID=644352 RepID=J3NJ40_GAET3|nr:hypothetical protein GGTG_01274 [Gaeumannomyces tritici R3-111a-1]EJT81290.1 hypothetical protein GGTG_01274 [Gaeumannomyces tritici R3-111a-1]